MSLADEKYVALTTYRSDGTSSSVPVWIARFDEDRLCLTTESTSLKAKRLGRDPRVLLAPSNARGVVAEGIEPVSGTAVVVVEPSAELAAARDAIKAKYGLWVTLIGVFYRVSNLVRRTDAGGSDAAVLITLD